MRGGCLARSGKSGDQNRCWMVLVEANPIRFRDGELGASHARRRRSLPMILCGSGVNPSHPGPNGEVGHSIDDHKPPKGAVLVVVGDDQWFDRTNFDFANCTFFEKTILLFIVLFRICHGLGFVYFRKLWFISLGL